jgi:hypothetical protein
MFSVVDQQSSSRHISASISSPLVVTQVYQMQATPAWVYPRVQSPSSQKMAGNSVSYYLYFFLDKGEKSFPKLKSGSTPVLLEGIILEPVPKLEGLLAWGNSSSSRFLPVEKLNGLPDL